MTFLCDNYKKFDQKNTSFCKQLNNVEKKTQIDVMDYSLKTSLAIIDHLFIEENRGLVDSIKFIVTKIKLNMELNLAYFKVYDLLNDLLKIDFYK